MIQVMFHYDSLRFVMIHYDSLWKTHGRPCKKNLQTSSSVCSVRCNHTMCCAPQSTFHTKRWTVINIHGRNWLSSWAFVLACLLLKRVNVTLLRSGPSCHGLHLPTAWWFRRIRKAVVAPQMWGKLERTELKLKQNIRVSVALDIIEHHITSLNILEHPWTSLTFNKQNPPA